MSNLFYDTTMRSLSRLRFARTLKSPVFSKVSLLVTISVATIFIVYENIVIPPFNVTREERIVWFQDEVQRIELFESRNPNSEFHDRVSCFFVSNCTVRYFMVWLSPARSFGAKEILAVDSLFKASPEGCLMILSPSLDSRQGCRILKHVIDGGFKVLAVTPDLPFLVKDTPTESWLDELKTCWLNWKVALTRSIYGTVERRS